MAAASDGARRTSAMGGSPTVGPRPQDAIFGPMRLPLLLAASVLANAAEPARPAGDQPLAVKAKAQAATVLYRSQILPPLDRPVGEAINIGGRTMAARTTAKGALEVDLAGDGKFKAFAKTGPLSLTLEKDKPNGRPGEKARLPITLWLDKGGDGAWTWRNATRIAVQIGPDVVELVDADGDGAWNTPGKDGLGWAGQEWVWPLPAEDERWCTPAACIASFSIGPWGEEPRASGRPLATVLPETLPMLRALNLARARLGLPTRPEDPALSAPLQKHCAYMVGTTVLAHPEDPGKPGYTPEGHEAGMNSILSKGVPPENVPDNMIATFYHRIDCVRPRTLGFGLGSQGGFCGIDGRRNQHQAPVQWPILVPAPDQAEVPTAFIAEMPDPIPGDKSAGFPITAYFDAEPVLKKGVLTVVAGPGQKPGTEVDCYRFDAKSGGEITHNRYQKVAALIPKEPLASGAVYEVAMEVEAGGATWVRTWRFLCGKRK